MMYRFYGMVRLDETPQRLSCSWDVRNACPGALEVAATFLRQAGRPVKLRLYFGGWQEEHFSDPELAAQRLETSLAYARAEPLLRPCIVRRPLSEARDARRPYGKLLRRLEASGGILTPRLQRTLRDCGLLRRLVLFEECEPGGALILSHVGEHSALARFYGLRWAREAVNQPFEQEPFAMGHLRSISDAYRDTLESGEARFDHIRAPFARGTEDLHWLSYKRLLAPHLLSDGGRGLMLLSDFSRSVEIPFMGWLADGPAYPQQQAA